MHVKIFVPVKILRQFFYWQSILEQENILALNLLRQLLIQTLKQPAVLKAVADFNQIIKPHKLTRRQIKIQRTNVSRGVCAAFVVIALGQDDAQNYGVARAVAHNFVVRANVNNFRINLLRVAINARDKSVDFRDYRRVYFFVNRRVARFN